MIQIYGYAKQLEDIGQNEFEGTAEDRATYFEDLYNRSYAVASAVIELVEDFNNAQA